MDLGCVCVCVCLIGRIESFHFLWATHFLLGLLLLLLLLLLWMFLFGFVGQLARMTFEFGCGLIAG